MTTTPTVGNEVPFSTFFMDFGQQVRGLSDGTFAIVWERVGGNLVGRHLNELGGFTGGDFLTALSGSTAKRLTDPQIYQQADGQIVVDYTEALDSSSQRDVRWHEVDRVTPNAGSVGTEVLPTVDEFLFDSTNLPEIGSAHVFGAENAAGQSYLVLRYTDLNGARISDGIILDIDLNKVELDAAVRANPNGVAVAYEQFDNTTFDRQINLKVFGYNGAPLSGVVPVSGPGADPRFPDIATLSNGSYVVTWEQTGGIAFRNYNGNGAALDAAPVIIPNSAGSLPKITALKDGGFIIAWTARDGTESDLSPELDIFLQRFDHDGNAVGDRVHLNQPGDQGFFDMSIATLADGRVILTYQSETGDATNATTLSYRFLDPRDANILGTNGADNFVSREDGATISGFDGNDKLTGRAAIDVLSGGNGDDHLLGCGGNDQLDGGAGVDTIEGGDGNDLLAGGDGNDTLRGGKGNDRIQGDGGADSMHGGTGADAFRFDDGHAGLGAVSRDRISSFQRSQGDKLDVELIDANLNTADDQDFVFRGSAAFTGIGQIRVVGSGTDRIIQGNNDSDLQADFEINLVAFNRAMLASDFSDL